MGLDIYLRDTQAHTTSLVSRASGIDGEDSNSFSNSPSVSADGRYVAFESFATNLSADDVGNALDVFVRDMLTHETILVSRASGATGPAGNIHSYNPSISADGRYVVFESQATNLHPDDSDLVRDIFVRDLLTHETALVSRADGPDGVKGGSASFNPSLTADGRFVVFDSGSNNLDPDSHDAYENVFVRDLQDHETVFVSRADGVDGAAGLGANRLPTISNDGRYVAFESLATNLHPDDTDALADTFVRDLQTAETLLVSRADGAGGGKGNAESKDPAISADGRTITFSSTATNLHSGDFDAIEDVFTRDLQTHVTTLLSRAGGDKGDADSRRPSISGDGRYVAFESLATNLHADDPDAISDVLLRDQESPIWSPVGLEVDLTPVASNANGALEPGEQVEVAPAWRNDGVVTGTLQATADDLVGPPGPTYTLVATNADYGPVDPGEPATCRDTGLCYRVEVGPLGVSRPAMHWDASFIETLSDHSSSTWTLHVGDSFADVSVGNLFYRSVETLLHHGVTGGCTEENYCPTAPNTRAQMAVFVLRAAEGLGYAPPACVDGGEVFDDVPFDSPFCPWIEELFDRQVIAGCGGTDFCPGAAVTRAQMAIFLLRTLEDPGYAPATCSGNFADVPCPSLFADWIEELAARQITAGCVDAPPRYCPSEPVTRQQMAAFIGKAFGLTLYTP